MIQYDPLWKTMAKKKAIYLYLKSDLRHEPYNSAKDSSLISRLPHIRWISCKSLDCRLEDIAEYVPDDPK